MSEATPRLELPFILPGQAQKEFFHNEALTRIDALLHASVEGAPTAAPPAAPAEGQSWIVGPAAVGTWQGRDGALATWTSGGWRFAPPFAGLSVWDRAAGHRIYWRGNEWSEGEHPVTELLIGGKKVVGERQPPVPSPSGGTIIDEEARAAVEAIIATLKSHGLTE